jgi:hypothetical protein
VRGCGVYILCADESVNSQFQDPLISNPVKLQPYLASAKFLLTVENLHNMNRVGSVSSGINHNKFCTNEPNGSRFVHKQNMVTE